MKIRTPVKEFDPFRVEQKIKNYWARTYAYTRDKNSKVSCKPFYFVDGPPFTTGSVTLGMAWNKLLKDAYIRFMKLQGFNVLDRPGFDMHGLPVEVKVEESLGITSKRQIEEIGVEQFVNKCIDYANEYKTKMTEQYKNLGIWMDWQNPYLTADTSYLESVWWSLKQAHEKKILEKRKQVTSWCPRCESPLAQGEVRYKEKEGHSVYFKIPIKGRRDEYIIVWSTTPWTFAGCLAIAVHPDLNYARVAIRQGGRKSIIIVLESHVEEIAGAAGIEAYEIVETVKGRSLENLGFFHPLMADIPFHKTAEGEWCHKIIAIDSVHDSHTGCVYISPGLGIADSKIGEAYSLPIFSPVDERGVLTTEIGMKYAGLDTIEANNSILADMKTLRFVLSNSMHLHKGGHCWRCKSPIVNRATEQWFLKSADLQDVMLKIVKGAHWYPENFGTTRQHDWVSKGHDWCISRQRFWGTPLPIWECIADVCGHTLVVGSVKELEDASGYKEDMNLHRPWIDSVSLECPKCGGLMKRVPDIVDVWFDSSIASWGQLAYPRKKKTFKDVWPADWVAEGQEQSKGWFYNQIFTGAMLFNKIPFRKVLAHGTLHDIEVDIPNKERISTESAIENHGIDALRLYMLGMDPTEPAMFNPGGVKKCYSVLKILWNCYSFTTSYMSMDRWEPTENVLARSKGELRQEDLWILSRIESLSHDVKREMESMRMHLACKHIQDFILDDLSRWYVKITRERMWKEGLTPDKEAVYSTYREVLSRLSVISSPFIPHIAEAIYQELDGKELSVSMVPWPETDGSRLAEGMERGMNQARTIVKATQKFRQDIGLGLRWPIKKMTISAAKEEVTSAVRMFSDLIKDQANVKELELVPENQEWAGQELIVVPNPKAIGKSYKQRKSKIARMLKVLPAKEIKAKIEAGEYHLGIEGELIKILPDMVRFETKLPEGVVSINFSNGILYFDTKMDDELMAEGFAREIIRRIQQMRKEAGLDPEEYIKLRIKLDEAMLDLLDKWLEKIADSTRASQMEIVDDVTEDEYIVEWPIQEETVLIGITPLNIRKAMNVFNGLKEIDNELALAIVESGILTASDFLEKDRDEILKISGMNHSKYRKLKEFLELPEEKRLESLESACPLCNGPVEPGSATCQRCGKDIVGDEDLLVEIIRSVEYEDEPEYAQESVREKVKKVKKKKAPAEDEPEDEIVKMASDGKESDTQDDSLAAEIIDSIDVGEDQAPRAKSVGAVRESLTESPEKNSLDMLETLESQDRLVDQILQVEAHQKTVRPYEETTRMKPIQESFLAEPEHEAEQDQGTEHEGNGTDFYVDTEDSEEEKYTSDGEDPETEHAICHIAETFDIKKTAAKILYNEGYTTPESLAIATEDELREIRGIGKITARRIVQKSTDDESKICSLCNAIVPVNSPVCTRCGVKFVIPTEPGPDESGVAPPGLPYKKPMKEPSDSDLLHSKALTLKDAGRYEEALQATREGLEISPEDGRLQNLQSELQDKLHTPVGQTAPLGPYREPEKRMAEELSQAVAGKGHAAKEEVEHEPVPRGKQEPFIEPEPQSRPGDEFYVRDRSEAINEEGHINEGAVDLTSGRHDEGNEPEVRESGLRDSQTADRVFPSDSLRESPISARYSDREGEHVTPDEKSRSKNEAISRIAETYELKNSDAKALYEYGYTSVGSLANATEDELAHSKVITKETALHIINKMSQETVTVCSTCGTRMSSAATSCPYCGVNVPREETELSPEVPDGATIEQLDEELRATPNDISLLRRKAQKLNESRQFEDALLVIYDALAISPLDQQLQDLKKEIKKKREELKHAKPMAKTQYSEAMGSKKDVVVSSEEEADYRAKRDVHEQIPEISQHDSGLDIHGRRKSTAEPDHDYTYERDKKIERKALAPEEEAPDRTSSPASKPSFDESLKERFDAHQSAEQERPEIQSSRDEPDDIAPEVLTGPERDAEGRSKQHRGGKAEHHIPAHYDENQDPEKKDIEIPFKDKARYKAKHTDSDAIPESQQHEARQDMHGRRETTAEPEHDYTFERDGKVDGKTYGSEGESSERARSHTPEAPFDESLKERYDAHQPAEQERPEIQSSRDEPDDIAPEVLTGPERDAEGRSKQHRGGKAEHRIPAHYDENQDSESYYEPREPQAEQEGQPITAEPRHDKRTSYHRENAPDWDDRSATQSATSPTEPEESMDRQYQDHYQERRPEEARERSEPFSEYPDASVRNAQEAKEHKPTPDEPHAKKLPETGTHGISATTVVLPHYEKTIVKTESPNEPHETPGQQPQIPVGESSGYEHPDDRTSPPEAITEPMQPGDDFQFETEHGRTASESNEGERVQDEPGLSEPIPQEPEPSEQKKIDEPHEIHDDEPHDDDMASSDETPEPESDNASPLGQAPGDMRQKSQSSEPLGIDLRISEKGDGNQPHATPDSGMGESTQARKDFDRGIGQDIIDPSVDRTIASIAETFEIRNSTAKNLYNHGFTSIESVSSATESDLREIGGMDEATARHIGEKASRIEIKTCPMCNAAMPVNSSSCPQCGAKLASGDEAETRSTEKNLETLEKLDKELKSNPNDIELLQSKAMTLRDMGRYEDARVVLNQAITIAPNDARLLILYDNLTGEEYSPDLPEPAAPDEPTPDDAAITESLMVVPDQTLTLLYTNNGIDSTSSEPADEHPPEEEIPRETLPEADAQAETESGEVIAEEPSIAEAPVVEVALEPEPEIMPESEELAAEESVPLSGTVVESVPEMPEHIASPGEETVAEPIVEPDDSEMKLKSSFTYLIPEERSVHSYHLFKVAMARGMPGYCVTRTFPEKVRERYELGTIPILWLSNVAKEEAVRPKDLEKLSLSLEEFLGKEGGIILLDGIEYLITNNNFITVLKLIQSLRDQVAINRSILLISINPSTMDSHQINLLKREVDSVIE